MNRLYIIVRNDIDSLVGGKMSAQVAHAANMFQTFCDNEFQIWSDGSCFGTTIVLSAPYSDIVDIVERSTFSGIVHDPTFPIKDGITLTVPLNTCGFVYIPDDISLFSSNTLDIYEKLKNFDLA